MSEDQHLTQVHSLSDEQLEELRHATLSAQSLRRQLDVSPEKITQAARKYQESAGIKDGGPWEYPASPLLLPMKGSKRTHSGAMWRSQLDFNSFEPGVKGWTLQENGDADDEGAGESDDPSGDDSSPGSTWWEQLSSQLEQATADTPGLMPAEHYRRVQGVGQLSVRIPGDYPTLQHAVDDLAPLTAEQGAEITLLIEAGHQPRSGIQVSYADYSRFRIASESPVVEVHDTFTGPFILGISAGVPRLSCMVDMRDKGDQGYAAHDNSQGTVDNRCGVRNAGSRGCHVRGSQVWATGSEFTGSNDRNLHVTGGAFFEGDAGKYGSNKGGNYCVYVSRASHATLDAADITNAYQVGIGVLRSQVNARSADVSGAGTDGVSCSQASLIAFNSGKASNCGHRGIVANQGSTVEASSSTADNCVTAGALATFGSWMNVNGANLRNAGQRGLVATTGSHINARDADTSGHKHAHGISVSNGAIINAGGSAGALNQAANTVTSSGIIFK